MPDQPIAAPEQETSEVEVSIEVPTMTEGDAAPMAEQGAASPDSPLVQEPEPAPSAPAAPDSEMLSALTSERDALMAERDALVGRMASIQGELSAALARLASYDADMLAMRAKLASYELGAALADNGLPNQAAGLVSRLYADDARVGGAKTPGVRAWLAASLADPNHPAAALALMRGPGTSDPSARPPVDVHSSSLSPFPSIGARR